MADLRFTGQHQWARLDGDVAIIGITKYAAEQLGDIVYVKLPEAGRRIASGAEAATVESLKAASEVYAPVGGEVTEANPVLAGDPMTVNADPEGKGWFFKLKSVNKDEFAKLMTAEQYADFVKGL